MSETALATTEDVVKRLEEEPSPEMLTMIAEYLEDASDLARDYGLESWAANAVPAPVSRIVAAAVARFIRNPEGLATSRAADETLAWGEAAQPVAPTFEPEEIKRIQRLARRERGFTANQAFGSVQVYAHGNRPQGDTIYVPWGDRGTHFPLIAVNDPLGYYQHPGA